MDAALLVHVHADSRLPASARPRAHAEAEVEVLHVWSAGDWRPMLPSVTRQTIDVRARLPRGGRDALLDAVGVLRRTGYVSRLTLCRDPETCRTRIARRSYRSRGRTGARRVPTAGSHGADCEEPPADELLQAAGTGVGQGSRRAEGVDDRRADRPDEPRVRRRLLVGQEVNGHRRSR